jgi:ABC-type Fe3+/spermidine/putrescine transport system ATPase subunit
VREALAIADRAYVMKAGRIVYCGPPADIDDHAKLMDLYWAGLVRTKLYAREEVILGSTGKVVMIGNAKGKRK